MTGDCFNLVCVALQSPQQAKRALAKSFERRSFAEKEAFVNGQPRGVDGSLLCEGMTNWHTECAASTDDRCEVFISEKQFVGSCSAFCRSQVSARINTFSPLHTTSLKMPPVTQGLNCTDGYDDSSRGRCARAPKQSDCSRGEDG